jgi:hypothetical protein
VVGCGDGSVSAAEECDTAIAAGMTGACPTSCPALTMGTACVTRQLLGSACQTECIEVPGTCTNGDGCCPPTCTAATDSDCSANCGNGVIDSNTGETCEPAATAADGGVDSGVDAGTPCPEDPDDCDDDDPCTVESVLGSAQNCNAECLSTEITRPVDNDGCCPSGANSIADDDCPIDCGNGVVEEGEECDGSDGCDDECLLTLTTGQRQCLEDHVVDGSPSEECQRCACIQCPTEVLDCRADSNATRAMKCNTLINCALNNDCTGISCFCGTDALCFTPNGECRNESAAAADEPTGAPNLITVYERCNETAKPGVYACSRANQLGVCAAMNCASCPQP